MKLSIIIPVFNVEDYLEACLHSLFDHSVPKDEFEVIIVNDGSPDRSIDIAKLYANQHSNIRILEQDNQGLSAARTNGLGLAKGDYVWFVDSDDWLLSQGLPTVINDINKYSDADVLSYPLLRVYEMEQRDNHPDYQVKDEAVFPGKEVLQNRIVPVFAIQRFVIQRRLFSDSYLCFPTGLLFEDEYFGRVLLYIAKKVFTSNRPVYAYRQRSGSITTVLNVYSASDLLKIHQLLLSFREYRVLPEDKRWFEKDVLRLLRSSFTRNEKLYLTKEFKSFRRQHLPYILKEYRIYGASLSFAEWLSDISLFLFPVLHTRLYYLFEPLIRG